MVDHGDDAGVTANLGERVDPGDALLRRALESLRPVVSFDLAVIFELDTDGLGLLARTASGPLALDRVRRNRLVLAHFPTIARALELAAVLGQLIALAMLQSEQTLAPTRPPRAPRELARAERVERAPLAGSEVINAFEKLLSPDMQRTVRADEALDPLDDIERRYIAKVVARCDGRLYGERGAAQILGLKPTNLQSRMARLGMRPSPTSAEHRRR